MRFLTALVLVLTVTVGALGYGWWDLHNQVDQAKHQPVTVDPDLVLRTLEEHATAIRNLQRTTRCLAQHQTTGTTSVIFPASCP